MMLVLVTISCGVCQVMGFIARCAPKSLRRLWRRRSKTWFRKNALKQIPRTSQPNTLSAPSVPSAPPSQTATGNNNGQVGGSVTTGDCSNVQIGGTGNQATTNCVPPDRHLTQAQFDAISDVTKGLPADMSAELEVLAVSDKDAIHYASEIRDALQKHTKINFQMELAPRETMPEVICVCVNNVPGSVFDIAQRLATAMNNSGINGVLFAKMDKQPDNHIVVLIGVRPKKS